MASKEKGLQMKRRFALPGVALATAAMLMAAMPPAFAQAGKGGARASSPGAGRSVQHRHHHRGPRVGVGVGIGLGFGGFYDPFFDPYYPYGYPAYGGYAVAPQPPVPCTAADVPKSEPTNNAFSPDFAYDRIDAGRCTPQAVAEAQAAQAAQAVQQAPAAAPNAPAQPPGAFYFCRSTNAYYPYVSTCAEGWQQVEPRPPGT
jgi:hypothetical protein